MCSAPTSHDTFLTRCYETRFIQHLMMVITYVNAVNAAKYFNPAAYHKSTPQKYILLELAGKMVRNDEWPICASRRPKTGRPAAPPAARRAPAPPKTRCTTHEPEP